MIDKYLTYLYEWQIAANTVTEELEFLVKKLAKEQKIKCSKFNSNEEKELCHLTFRIKYNKEAEKLTRKRRQLCKSREMNLSKIKEKRCLKWFDNTEKKFKERYIKLQSKYNKKLEKLKKKGKK